MVISDTNNLMILNHEKFASFTTKPLADPATSTAALICLSQDSRAAVDHMTEAALAHGGTESKPAQDLGFISNRSFHDPDGNVFEPMWMDPAAAQD